MKFIVFHHCGMCSIRSLLDASAQGVPGPQEPRGPEGKGGPFQPDEMRQQTGDSSRADAGAMAEVAAGAAAGAARAAAAARKVEMTLDPTG